MELIQITKVRNATASLPRGWRRLRLCELGKPAGVQISFCYHV
jgi:hypothetical protein